VGYESTLHKVLLSFELGGMVAVMHISLFN